jgi:hypothetical protein
LVRDALSMVTSIGPYSTPSTVMPFFRFASRASSSGPNTRTR